MSEPTPSTTGTPAGAPVVHLKSDDPNLAGEIKFRILNLYQEIAVSRRMAELANLGAAPGAKPVHVDQLPAFGRYVIEAVATLEQAIVHAPAGFYEATQSGPELAVGRLSTVDQDVLVAAYEGYHAYRARFRDARGGHRDGAPHEPSGAAGGDRGAPHEPEPA